jgi:hypothetical protein
MVIRSPAEPSLNPTPNLTRVVEGDVNDFVMVGLEHLPPMVGHDIVFAD